MGVHAHAHGAVAKPIPCSRRLFLFVAVLVVLIGSYCAAAAADEQMNSNSRDSRRRRSRRRTAATAAEAVTPAAPLMVPITILKSAVDSGAGMHAYTCFSFFNSFPLPQSCIDST